MSPLSGQSPAREIAQRNVRFFCINVPGPSAFNYSLPGGCQAIISQIVLVWNTTSQFDWEVAINGELIAGLQITGSTGFSLGTSPIYYQDLPLLEGDTLTVSSSSTTDPLSFANAYTTAYGTMFGVD
jgi:hypothetical protein